MQTKGDRAMNRDEADREYERSSRTRRTTETDPAEVEALRDEIRDAMERLHSTELALHRQGEQELARMCHQALAFLAIGLQTTAKRDT